MLAVAHRALTVVHARSFKLGLDDRREWLKAVTGARVASRRGLKVNDTAGERAARFALAPVVGAYLAACEAAVGALTDDNCAVKELWVFVQFARGAVHAPLTGGAPGVGDMSSAMFRGSEMLVDRANASLEDRLSKPSHCVCRRITDLPVDVREADRVGGAWVGARRGVEVSGGVCRCA